MGQTYQIHIVLRGGQEIKSTHHAYSITRAFAVARAQHPNWASISVSVKREDVL